ncbi:MAG: hypothetical protein PWR13_1382 [Archaeoglobi archaeon]|nr:hypothetical protein [Archaeoglobi archaeon]MDK2782354.1 hypothetical protein [Archaeoglobi archaeon]
MIRRIAEEIRKEFFLAGHEIPIEEIEKRLETLILKFKVPEEEARRSVYNYFLKELNLKFLPVSRDSELVKIADIREGGRWVSLKAKVLELWEPRSDSVSQVGLIGDETGVMKFVIWSKSELPEVEEGRSYLFRNVISDVYQGRVQINVNRNSEIIELQEDISARPREIELRGAVVDIYSGSGLIQRCPECRRIINKGVCAVHGKVTGIYDLRVRAVLDDGEETYDLFLDSERVQKICNLDVERAKKMIAESLDKSVVEDYIAERLFGKYFAVKGRTLGRYFFVEDMEPLELRKEDVEELLEEAGMR